MESKEITRLDLAKGATIFKQGHYETLGFTPRNAEGEVVDLTGKDINVVIVKGRSIVYDVAGTYDSVSNTIQFVIAENIGHGDMWMEITVTDPKNASYRQKFPTSEYDGKLKFIRSSDDADYVGFSGKSVAQFQETFNAAVAAVTKDSEVALARKNATTLGQRLDADKQELNQQLQGKATKDELGRLLAGTPKGSYPTLSALQSAFPSGTEGIFIVAADGNWYFWNTTGQWTAGGVYQATVIPNSAITTDKLGDLVRGKNLFNKEMISMGYIDRNSGEVRADTGNRSSDFIIVNPGQSYTFMAGVPITTGAINIAYYNANKVYISGAQIVSGATSYTITTPANAVYIRFSINAAFIERTQLEIGAVASPFEKYYLYNKNLVKPGEGEKPFIETETQIKNGIIPLEKLSGVARSKNIYNKAKNTKGYISRFDGTFAVESTNESSDFIIIEQNVAYTFSPKITGGALNYAFFDAAKLFIAGGQFLPTSTGQTITAPERAVYIRFSIRADFAQNAQLEKGALATPFESFYIYFKDIVEPPSFPGADEEESSDGALLFQSLTPSSKTLNVFIPANKREKGAYIKFPVKHEAIPFTDGGTYQNSDLWRMNAVTYSVLDDNRNILSQEEISNNGAWECAIAIDGTPDFHGTYHGYELVKSFFVYLDGVKVDLTKVINSKATEIRMVHNSDLIKQGTAGEVIATVARTYLFNEDGWTLWQKYNWLQAFPKVNNAYITMVPIKRFAVGTDKTSKQITDTVITDWDWNEYDISDNAVYQPINAQKANVKMAHIYGKKSKYSLITEVDYANKNVPNVFNVSAADAYNKFYFSYATGAPIKVGDVWEVKTKIKVQKGI